MSEYLLPGALIPLKSKKLAAQLRHGAACILDRYCLSQISRIQEWVSCGTTEPCRSHQTQETLSDTALMAFVEVKSIFRWVFLIYWLENFVLRNADGCTQSYFMANLVKA